MGKIVEMTITKGKTVRADESCKNMATTPALLKHAAFDLWQSGHRIVPLKGKIPLVAWQRWQSEPQSPQDF